MWWKYGSYVAFKKNKKNMELCEWKHHQLWLPAWHFPVFVNLSIWISAHSIPLMLCFVNSWSQCCLSLTVAYLIFTSIWALLKKDELARYRWIFFQHRMHREQEWSRKIQAGRKKRRKGSKDTCAIWRSKQ